MQKPCVQVTDHAVVRYLERVGGFDIAALRAEIARRCDPAYSIGASSIIIEGFAFLIGDGKVITVVHASTMKKRRIRQLAVPGRPNPTPAGFKDPSDD